MRTPRLTSSVIVAGTATLLFLGCSLVPYTSTEIPEWPVQVIDSRGQPAAKMEVHQVVLFSGRRENWFETKRTDTQGCVTFPKRTIRASFLDRAVTRVRMYKSRYPYGASAEAWVCSQGFFASSDARGKLNWIGGQIRLKLVNGSCPYAPEW
jgi:hypothetical protein